METRQITQIRVFYLILNNVYDYCEGRTIVAVSDSREKLIGLYNDSLIPYEERYRDEGGMYRSFKKGLLYDFNPVPFVFDGATYAYDDLGIKDTWINESDLDDVKKKYIWYE